MWFDRKTRRGRCMKLNTPWSGPLKKIKRFGEVVYIIKYEESETISAKRRAVHHNQLKRFMKSMDLKRRTITTGSNDEANRLKRTMYG